VQAAFDAAKSQGVNFLLRGPDRMAFTTADGHFDLAAVTAILHNTFDGTTLVAILLLWASKPCHPGMFNITVTEMA